MRTTSAPITFIAGAALLLATLAAGAAAPSLPGVATQTAGEGLTAAVPEVNRPQELARISRAINRVETLKAHFTQIDAQGIAQGTFYLSRPGRMRFEYDPPSPILIVADGRTVLVRDAVMETVYRAKIDETPLRLLLQADLDLSRDARITDLSRDGGLLYVTAEETEGYAQGQITLVFAEPEMRLIRWIVRDPMGAETTVVLRDVEEGGQFERELFRMPAEKSERTD